MEVALISETGNEVFCKLKLSEKEIEVIMTVGLNRILKEALQCRTKKQITDTEEV